MKDAPLTFGVDLGHCNPSAWRDVTQAAEGLGYESVWIPEHLVFPAELRESPAPDDPHIGIDPFTPTFDPFVFLASLAAGTRRIRLGTNVYNIGLRHPFVTARAATTLDVISEGRLILGIGASWLSAEWEAVGLDFATRGDRIDEIIDICRRLWTAPTVSHSGRFFDFEAVAFEPKPIQSPLPIHVGGDSRRALRRAAEQGQGWIAMIQTPATFADAVATLRRLCDAHGRDADEIERTALAAQVDDSAVEQWTAAGATRLIVAPWRRTSEFLRGLEELAERVGLEPAG